MARTEGGSPIERTTGSEMADVVSGEKKTVLNQGDVRDAKADMLRNVGTSNGVLEGGDAPRAGKSGAAGKGGVSDGVRALGRKAAAAAVDSDELRGMDKAVGTSVAIAKELRHPLSKSLRERARKYVNPAAAASALGAMATDSDELRGMDSMVETSIQAARLAKRGASRYSQAKVNAANAARGVQSGSAGTDAAKSAADSTKGKKLGDKASKKAGKKASKKAASALNAEKAAADKALAHMAASGAGGATAATGGIAAGGAATGAGTVATTVSAIASAIAPILMPILLILVVLMCLALFMCGGAASQDDEQLEAEAMPAFELQEYLNGSGDDKESEKYQKWAGLGTSTAWCGAFQGYSAEQVGLTLGTDVPSKGEAPLAASWVTWFQSHKSKGTVHKVGDGYEPQVGDIAVRYNKAGQENHVEVVAATNSSDCAYIDDIIKSFNPKTDIGKKRKAHLKEVLNDAIANKDLYLSVGGNTGDTDVTGSGIDRLGAKTKRIDGTGKYDANYFVHIDMPMIGSGNFKKYKLSNSEAYQIAALCQTEQGTSAKGVAMEASLIANRYQYYLEHQHGTKSLFAALNDTSTCVGGFFLANLSNLHGEALDDNVKVVKKVICEGKRALPLYINEHDTWPDDIAHISTGSMYRKSDFVKGETVIYNTYKSTYTFYAWSPANDPFGYTSDFYNTYKSHGEKHYNY